MDWVSWRQDVCFRHGLSLFSVVDIQILRLIHNSFPHRSGKLNAKQREILELQAKAQARLAKSRARFAEGMQDAKEVKRDLEWTQKRVS